ncbi:MAG: hypothetical protein NTZ34_06740 [Chloroflexi bacterium]|nr:hypothetical protein [Chloroflexota bacterium]
MGELPKGKVLGIFDRSDIFKVKDVLGDTLCIAGNMQPSLLEVGSTDQVKEYTKKLIDIVGKGGGFIMSCSIIMEANPQLLRVWSDFTREYGRYY